MFHDGWTALPHGATGLSVVGFCDISWSYSLTIFDKHVFVIGSLWRCTNKQQNRFLWRQIFSRSFFRRRHEGHLSYFKSRQSARSKRTTSQDITKDSKWGNFWHVFQKLRSWCNTGSCKIPLSYNRGNK